MTGKVSLTLDASVVQLVTRQMTSCLCYRLLIDSHCRLPHVDHHWRPPTRDWLHLHLRGVSQVSFLTSKRFYSYFVFCFVFFNYFFQSIFLIFFFWFHILSGCYALTNVAAFTLSHSDSKTRQCIHKEPSRAAKINRIGVD